MTRKGRGEFCLQAGQHRYKARIHQAGCHDEAVPHLHVRCRFCRFAWYQLALPGMPMTEVLFA